MLADYIFAGIAIFGATIGTITDLKGRWVPDWINYFMIAFGLVGHAIVSLIQNSVWPLIFSAIFAGIFFAIGTTMVYTGLWGGGDAKMLTGLGALLPTVSFANTPWPFPLTLWLNIMIMGAVLGVIGALILIVKNKSAFFKELRVEFEKNKLAIMISPAILILPIVSFYLDMKFVTLASLLLFILIPIIFIFKAVEKACMFKFIAPSKLVEGDWIAEEIKVGNYSYKPPRSGIELKDISELQKLEKLGKLKQIKVKEGLPYTPAFLAGLLASLFLGDIMFALVTAILI
jgi:preflagellin peptidase FlaK